MFRYQARLLLAVVLHLDESKLHSQAFVQTVAAGFGALGFDSAAVGEDAAVLLGVFRPTNP